MTIETCQRCLYPSTHPLGLVIDEEGICSGCRIHEEKDIIDWNERWIDLEKIIRPYRSRDSRNYDCIIPVSGAGDSHFIVHTVVNRLKLKPLLVSYNKYYNTPIGIRNLANLRRKFDCDILIQNVSMTSVKAIIRTTLRRLGSFHWPAIAGQTVFPVQVAVSHKIPLIIWGAHQGVEQVGMFSHLHNAEMTRRYRKDHDLMGLEADDLLTTFDNLREEQIWQYRYPHWSDIDRIGVRGIYLSNYIRWDPLTQHHQMVKDYEYESAEQTRTFDTYDHIDDWHYADTHDYIKKQKTGISKCMDHACREIRHGRLSKEDAINICNYYESIKPIDQDLLLKWLQIPKEALEFIISQHTPTHFEETGQKRIENQKPIVKLFNANSTIERGGDRKHILIGKGYP